MNIKWKIVIVQIVFTLIGSFSKAQVSKNLKVWDNKPAKDWMTQAYPIGNGKLVGMVFGGIAEEHIQFNESSLWTGDEQETGAYQAFGDIFMDFKNIEEGKATQYKRELNLNDALHQINYQYNNQSYSRTYFSSNPDQVLVCHYTAQATKSYSLTIRLKDAHASKTQAGSDQLTFSGTLDNGLKYAAALTIKQDGGTLSVDKDAEGNSQIHLEGANTFTLFLSAATDYLNQSAKHWKGKNPQEIVAVNLRNALAKKYEDLRNDHVKDYQNLFNRVAIQIGNNHVNDQVPTVQQIVNYKKNTNPELETLLFQYGRYLLISSSRKGGLPANLQGLWNNSNNPPWRSDYHSNINIQMNYWPAEPTNLAESNVPYLDYINSMREVKKKNTQKQYPGVRGWTVKTENNIFGGESFLWNTPGSAWYAQALWDHYAFNQDKTYLKTFAYPILKEISEFWDDHLKRRPDGSIVAPNGWSPEHGSTEDGVSYDQQIVYDLFTNYMEAADSLKIDADYRSHIAKLRDGLLKPKIGKWGQLQEWETDKDDPNDKHRHASHLFALHPGRQISITNTPELARAAQVSLTARGDESTGWSMAWKMNFWARLHDGNHAYKILKNFITLVGGEGIDYNQGGGIYANLLCAHPPFQIDGNFGYTAGVAEMLLQSQEGFIDFLPAIPDQWKSSGEVKGLKVRGNVTVGFKWVHGKIISYSLTGPKASTIKIKLNGIFKTVKVKKV